VLKAQAPHYITIHIHGKPYLITQGDTIRLPFLMHGVDPGDVLRLNRAVNIGSRDYTLKAAAAPPKLKSPTTDSRTVVDPTSGLLTSNGAVMPEPGSQTGVAEQDGVVMAPHFIPHIAKGKFSYLDERLFVCRAVVMGVESEPLRFKEKTKRRQRKVKTVKSKHRFTILKIKEVRLRGLEELESGEPLD
jgi:large subunit ribosomal protein L21